MREGAALSIQGLFLNSLPSSHHSIYLLFQVTTHNEYVFNLPFKRSSLDFEHLLGHCLLDNLNKNYFRLNLKKSTTKLNPQPNYLFIGLIPNAKIIPSIIALGDGGFCLKLARCPTRALSCRSPDCKLLRGRAPSLSGKVLRHLVVLCAWGVRSTFCLMLLTRPKNEFLKSYY